MIHRSLNLSSQMKRRSGLPPAPIEFYPRRFYLLLIRDQPTCSIYRSKTSEDDFSNIERSFKRRYFPTIPGIQFISLNQQLPSQEMDLGIDHTIAFNSFLTTHLNQMTDDVNHEQKTEKKASNVQYFYLLRRYLWQEIQAIHFICRWRLMYLHVSPHEALAPFEHLSSRFSTLSSNVYGVPDLLESLQGIAKGFEMNLFDQSFSFKQTSNPFDFRFISNRFLVFRGLENEERMFQTEELQSSVQCEPLFSSLKQYHVSLLLTFNKRASDSSKSVQFGVETINISISSVIESVMKFLEIFENSQGLIAIDSSKDFGNIVTATCLGCFLMKHSTFTAKEAHSWLHFCLSRQLSNEYLHFLYQLESQMLIEGERFQQNIRVSRNDFNSSISTDSKHMKIGKIRLGRLALLGTRARDTKRMESILTNCVSSRSFESPNSPTRATTIAQFQRRPVTQGNPGNRRTSRFLEGMNSRVDFALMHKFLHQPPSITCSTSNVPLGVHRKVTQLETSNCL
ncbi:putative tyrosine-protein phosphatase CDC14 [Plasmopara halstedii]